MKNLNLIIRFLFINLFFVLPFVSVNAQVGVGNTSPQATLDITGEPAVTTVLDGVIAPRITGDQLSAKTYTATQTAAVIYVSAAAGTPAGQTINVTRVGYYYFDGTAWVALIDAEDGDFHKVGTSTAPTLITEDVFRSGNVGIGVTSPNYPLQVSSSTSARVGQFTRSGSDDGDNYSLFLENSNSGIGVHYGMRINISTASEDLADTKRHYGTYNQVNGAVNGTNQNIGTYNTSSVGVGSHTGTFNSMAGEENSTNVGTSNFITNTGDGTHTGTSNLLRNSTSNDTGTGTKIGNYTGINDSFGDNYGTYNEIFTTVTGKKSYGTFNDVNSNAGTNYAGWFDAHGTGGSYYAAIFNRGHVVANEASGDFDFRIEGQTDNDLFFADASTNNVGIGTNAPGAKLDVRGSATFNFQNGNKNFTVHSQNKNFTLHVDADADFVGINKQYPGYTLDVNGDINFSGDLYQAGTIYPDYVFESYFEGFSDFEKNYTFLSLGEVESYLKKYKHLPNVQSRAEVIKNGWKISEGVRDNLEKVEELFLHNIEASKQIKALENENCNLEIKLEKALNAIELLNSRLEKLEK
tara:strand:+ start:20238 stop:21974 length:1737 start_codon:yes stop_codon:yes gene_type:complete